MRPVPRRVGLRLWTLSARVADRAHSRTGCRLMTSGPNPAVACEHHCGVGIGLTPVPAGASRTLVFSGGGPEGDQNHANHALHDVS